jgi:hypothetical protein
MLVLFFLATLSLGMLLTMFAGFGAGGAVVFGVAHGVLSLIVVSTSAGDKRSQLNSRFSELEYEYVSKFGQTEFITSGGAYEDPSKRYASLAKGVKSMDDALVRGGVALIDSFVRGVKGLATNAGKSAEQIALENKMSQVQAQLNAADASASSIFWFMLCAHGGAIIFASMLVGAI